MVGKSLTPMPSSKIKEILEKYRKQFSAEWWKGFGTSDDIDRQGVEGIKSFIEKSLTEIEEATRGDDVKILEEFKTEATYLDLAALHGEPMNEETIKKLTRFACDIRQNNVILEAITKIAKSKCDCICHQEPRNAKFGIIPDEMSTHQENSCPCYKSQLDK